MDGFMGLVVLASSLWMAVDASQLGYEKQDVRGLAAMGPVGWFFAGILLWIVAFPMYLIKRPELKAAGERRRQWALGGGAPGQLPGQVYGGGSPYGPQPYGGHGGGAQGWGAPPPPGWGGPGQQPGWGTPNQPGWGGASQPHGGPSPGNPPGYGAPPPSPGYGGSPAPGTGYGAPMPGAGQPGWGAPPAAGPRPDVAEAITKLAELHQRGLLSDVEFQAKKAELLARM